MRSHVSPLVLALVVATPAAAFAQVAPATETAAATAPMVTSEQVLKDYRNNMQATRANVIAKALTLTADEAAKFWPLFEKYQQEQNVIIDSQARAIQRFAEQYKTLTDADALDHIQAQLERDEKMSALRRKWLGEFQKILSPRNAARVIQVDRRLSNLAQVQLSSEIPLVP